MLQELKKPNHNRQLELIQHFLKRKFTNYFRRNFNEVNKQLLNSVLVGYEELLRLGLCYLPQPSASADNTNRGLNNSSYPTRTEFNNCFIIYLYLRIVLLFICILNFGISSVAICILHLAQAA